MAYQEGDLVEAGTNATGGSGDPITGFNGFRARLENMLGVGGYGPSTPIGSWGWGQLNLVNNLPPVKTTGNLIEADHWRSIRERYRESALHCGVSTTNKLPGITNSPFDYTTGKLVAAHNSVDGDRKDFVGLVSDIQASRVSVATDADMVVQSNAAWAITRNSTWGVGASEYISCKFNIGVNSSPDDNIAPKNTTTNFSTYDKMRYFFNTGGRIQIILSHPSTGIAQDNDWSTTFSSRVGTINIAALRTFTSGNTAYNNPVGYYQLPETMTWTTTASLLDVGSGAYSANDVIVSVMPVTTGDPNGRGAKGNQFSVRVVLRDQHVKHPDAPASTDLVSAGTRAEIRIIYCDDAVTNSGIRLPYASTDFFVTPDILGFVDGIIT